MPRKQHWYWVAFADHTEKVKLVRKGAAGHKLLREVCDPMTVENTDGDQFVMARDRLHDNPIDAQIECIELAKKHGLEAVRLEDTNEDEEEDGEEPAEEDEDEFDEEEEEDAEYDDEEDDEVEEDDLDDEVDEEDFEEEEDED